MKIAYVIVLMSMHATATWLPECAHHLYLGLRCLMPYEKGFVWVVLWSSCYGRVDLDFGVLLFLELCIGMATSGHYVTRKEHQQQRHFSKCLVATGH